MQSYPYHQLEQPFIPLYLHTVLLWFIFMHLPIFVRIASLRLEQSRDYSSAGEVFLADTPNLANSKQQQKTTKLNRLHISRDALLVGYFVFWCIGIHTLKLFLIIMTVITHTIFWLTMINIYQSYYLDIHNSQRAGRQHNFKAIKHNQYIKSIGRNPFIIHLIL